MMRFLWCLLPMLTALCSGLSTAAPPRKALPASVVTVRRDGIDVHIVGTIHSTPTSSRDVEETVRIAEPSCVVLELCGPRWCRLLNRIAKERRVGAGVGTIPTEDRNDDANPFVKWFYETKKEKRRLGTAPALISAALSLPYAAMRASGSESFRPGGEFLAAIETGRNLKETPSVVLGDVDATVTLSDLASSMQLHPYAGRSAGETWTNARRQIGVLGRALNVGGDGALDLRSMMGRTSTMRDLLVLLLPSLVFLACIEVSFGDPSPQLEVEQQLEHIIVVINVLLTAWTAAVAPDAIATMLDKRDDALASSIDAACTEVRRDQKTGSDSTPAIVAVVGLLHVNGVAARLAQPGWSGIGPSHRDWGRALRLRAGRLLVAAAHQESPTFRRSVLLLMEPVDSDVAGGSFGWTAVRLDMLDDVKSGRALVGSGGPCAARRMSHQRQTAATSQTASVERERFRLHRSADAAQENDTVISHWGGAPLVISNETCAVDEVCIELDGCAAWWPGQLEAEVAGGDWHVVDAPVDASDALFVMSALNSSSLSWEQLAPQ